MRRGPVLMAAGGALVLLGVVLGLAGITRSGVNCGSAIRPAAAHQIVAQRYHRVRVPQFIASAIVSRCQDATHGRKIAAIGWVAVGVAVCAGGAATSNETGPTPVRGGAGFR